MKGEDYKNRIARYVAHHFGGRGLAVYTEVCLGKTIIGKDRMADVVVRSATKVIAFECKYQESGGSADEKYMYALENMRALPFPGFVVYGDGAAAGERSWSPGVLHELGRAPDAAQCLPNEKLERTFETSELDFLLAVQFNLWDVVLPVHRLVSAPFI